MTDFVMFCIAVLSCQQHLITDTMAIEDLSKAMQPQIMFSLQFAGVLHSTMSAGAIKGLTVADQLTRLAKVIKFMMIHLLSL